ncbi:DNA methyltransferase [Archangium gephyra]|uniref:SAM-dependent methyltransferase n=1 Tax=Archangium gephyra TaxID=48 RepID=UPI0035D4A3C8
MSRQATNTARTKTVARVQRAIEREEFPFEQLSEVAEVESWRKEVFRPIYHVHKWWAQRLGSVFRAIVLGAAPGQRDPLMREFYQNVDLGGLVVFDPFMGSGTTVGEAAKLGCAAVGRDINPVAFTGVRVSLGAIDRAGVERAFEQVERTVGAEIRAMYRAKDNTDRECDVLYFFWVKVADCPECKEEVDLFSSYVFAKHAYVKKYPTVHIVCPECGEVFRGLHHEKQARCTACKNAFDPHSGPAKGMSAECTHCNHEFRIGRTLRASGVPPRHKLYAKLVLNADGKKEYLRATEADVAAFRQAEQRLATAEVVRPIGQLEPGRNTDQAINYGYQSWGDFFNARQLLALGRLGHAIRGLPEGPERDALALVFSGTLEFNNMFASYKGEGTGAVRHMFSHHVLKPERMPIEANPWGTPQSSGSFSTLFRLRLIRALEYRENPFEVAVDRAGDKPKGKKVFGTSVPLTQVQVHGWTKQPRSPGVYLSCGNSAATGLVDESVDLVVTDPPFFDNVHYSELADFFFAWQRELLPSGLELETTRQCGEVQDEDAEAFASKLSSVFTECRRVLVKDGLLVFSYHHSRDDGWVAVAQAIADAGFSLVQAHPVKAEMSVAAPKTQAAEPIDIDIIMVCRKAEADQRPIRRSVDAVGAALVTAEKQVVRFLERGRQLSRGDAKVLLLSRVLVELFAGRAPESVPREFEAVMPLLKPTVEALHRGQAMLEQKSAAATKPGRTKRAAPKE